MNNMTKSLPNIMKHSQDIPTYIYIYIYLGLIWDSGGNKLCEYMLGDVRIEFRKYFWGSCILSVHNNSLLYMLPSYYCLCMLFLNHRLATLWSKYKLLKRCFTHASLFELCCFINLFIYGCGRHMYVCILWFDLI